MTGPVTVVAADAGLLEKYQPGPGALLMFVLLALALVLLLRSMFRQFRRIDFDESATDDAGRMRKSGRDDEGGAQG